MMIRFLSIVCLLVFFASNTVNAESSERVIWDKQAIPVTLTVGHERLIHFPGDIRYWVPESLNEAVNVMAANGVLYIQSEQAFVRTRLRVQELDTQRIYLLDVVSQTTGDYPDNLIVTPKADVVSLSIPSETKTRPVDWPIRLMRFASQSLYAPERLSPVDPHIKPVSVDLTPVSLLRGGDTESTPLGQWKGGGLYVTAVLVRNLTDRSITIAPVEDKTTDTIAIPTEHKRTLSLDRDVRGSWLYSATQHTVLHPAGDDADRTSLYLVSRTPFAGAMQ